MKRIAGMSYPESKKAPKLNEHNELPMTNVAFVTAICKALSSKASLNNPWVRLINECKSKMADPRVLQSIYNCINPLLLTFEPSGYTIPTYDRKTGEYVIHLAEDPETWKLAPLNKHLRAFAGLLDIGRSDYSLVPAHDLQSGRVAWQLFNMLSIEEWDCVMLYYTRLPAHPTRHGCAFLLCRSPISVDYLITEILCRTYSDADHMWDDLKWRLTVCFGGTSSDIHDLVCSNLRRFVQRASPKKVIPSVQTLLYCIRGAWLASILWPLVNTDQIESEASRNDKISDPAVLQWVLENLSRGAARELSVCILFKWRPSRLEMRRIVYNFSYDGMTLTDAEERAKQYFSEDSD